MRKFDYKNRKWDSEILGLVAQIHEYKGRQELFLKQKPAELEWLVELAKVQSTEASNEIEGIRTTNTRLKQLCADKTTPRNRDEEEIMGYRDVLNTIHENYEYIPIRSSYILQLHRDLYKYSQKAIGGRFKNSQNYISVVNEAREEAVLFTPLAPYETPAAIDAICENYHQMLDEGSVDVLLLIPIFIDDFLCIHPFSDGNGRMSRLLTTLQLYKSGYVVGKYILQTILAAYRDFEDRVDVVGEKLAAAELVRRVVSQKYGKITKSDIMELCPAIGQKSVEASIRKLVDEGVLIKQGNGRGAYYLRSDCETKTSC